MSRTYRNRHGFVWWKQNKYRHWEARDGEEKVYYTWDAAVYDPEASRRWRRKKPNGADGTWSNTGHLTGMKNETDYLRRAYERKFINKIIKGEDIDDVLYPSEKLTKFLWWDYF